MHAMRRKLLVVHHAGFSHIPAVFHYIDSFRRHSRQSVRYFNAGDVRGEPDFAGFDAVWLNYCARRKLEIYDPAPVEEALRKFSGLKIVSLQDEFDHTNSIKAMIRDLGFDIVMTCVPADHIHEIYPPKEFPSVRFESVLTGYISDDLLLASDDCLPLAERSIPVGYRGRELPFRLGDLGWHKAELGRRMKRACEEVGLACDIEVNEESRIYGGDWIEWVKNCRVMLGCESGSNVFDFDNSLHEGIRKMWSPGMRYERVRKFVKQYECDFEMGQISPRIFEAALTRTAMALVRGKYSGVIQPGKHFVVIEPDYSNLDEVTKQITDIPAMQDMADRTYEHVIANYQANHYSGFVNRVDELIDRFGAAVVAGKGNGLPTTDRPLGNDPYLYKLLLGLRDRYEQVDGYLKAAIDGKLHVTRDGDKIQIAKFD